MNTSLNISCKTMALSCSLVASLGLGLTGSSVASPLLPETSGFNQNGNILISDQFNNRVIEVNKRHEIVWSFGDGSVIAGPHSVVAPNDAERVGNMTLISGTGAPAGAEPGAPNGAPDNRVILVNASSQIVWQYGQAGVTGSGFNQLNAPVCAVYLRDGNILITDQGNQRVIEVNMNNQILWQYGTTGVSGAGPNQLNNPNSAELLRNGDVLIADESNNRVIEVTRKGNIVWSYGNPSDTSILNGTAFASRLLDGATLITDSGNNRIVEVSKSGVVLGTYYTNSRLGSVANPAPTRAVRLATGDTLISDQFNNQVIELGVFNVIDFTQGEIGIAGWAADQLSAPYDAKVIGDYTGLTPPYGNFE